MKVGEQSGGVNVHQIQITQSLFSIVFWNSQFDQIAGVKIVEVRASSMVKRMFVSSRYAILTKMIGEGYFVLVASTDEASIKMIFNKIRDAIEARSSGNTTFVSSVNIKGDVVNQTGNFEVGYNEGVVDLSNA